MKKASKLCFRISLFLFVIFTACQEKELEEKQPPNLSYLKQEAAPANGRVAVKHQLFAFQGDQLFRVHSDTREVELVGTGWSGTEAATAFNGNLYAVQGGRLWRCSMSTGTCADLGPNWGGTSYLTNDNNSHVYGIQGNRLWKVNASNGTWAQLGNGEWGPSTEMSFTNHPVVESGVAVPYLYVQYGGTIYRVNKDLGSWTTFGNSAINPYTHPVGDLYNRNTSFIGILNGQLVRQNTGTGSLTTYSPAIWHGATDIAWTQYRAANGVDMSNIFILHGSQIHHYQKDVFSSWAYQGAVPGLTSVYKVVSIQGT